MNKYIIGLLFASLVAIGILSRALKVANNERTRIETNQRVLLRDSIEKYKTRNNMLVLSIEQLELNLSEVKKVGQRFSESFTI